MNRDELFTRLENSMMSIGKEMSHEQVGVSGCSPAQNHLLMVIGIHGATSIKQLAEQLKVTSGAITQHIDALEKAGLLTRSINLKNRREVIVEMTEQGKEAYKTIQSSKARMLRDLFVPLNDDDLRTLIKLIEKVSKTYSNNEKELVK
jgi:DNA-binding MarR family transcriptional regulator